MSTCFYFLLSCFCYTTVVPHSQSSLTSTFHPFLSCCSFPLSVSFFPSLLLFHFLHFLHLLSVSYKQNITNHSSFLYILLPSYCLSSLFPATAKIPPLPPPLRVTLLNLSFVHLVSLMPSLFWSPFFSLPPTKRIRPPTNYDLAAPRDQSSLLTTSEKLASPCSSWLVCFRPALPREQWKHYTLVINITGLTSCAVHGTV